jgi:hypothetical protein
LIDVSIGVIEGLTKFVCLGTIGMLPPVYQSMPLITMLNRHIIMLTSIFRHFSFECSAKISSRYSLAP